MRLGYNPSDIRGIQVESQNQSLGQNDVSRTGVQLLRDYAAVFRFEPRSFKFETYIPMNFPNPHGHTFDYRGRDIIFDATGGQP